MKCNLLKLLLYWIELDFYFKNLPNMELYVCKKTYCEQTKTMQ